MTDIQAGLGLAQLHKLERMQQVRTKYAARYQAVFGAMPELIIPYEAKENRHAWHLYVIQGPGRVIKDQPGSIHRSAESREYRDQCPFYPHSAAPLLSGALSV